MSSGIIPALIVTGCGGRGDAGSEVGLAMWSGDEEQNRYLQGPVNQALQDKYGLRLRTLPFSDIAEFLDKLSNEKRAGKTSGGSADLMWINGENFRTAKSGGLLYGPFADGLPNAGLYPDAARARDFGTPIEGFEAPWQRAQFVFAYDPARVSEPPRGGIEALHAWISGHPGRFTYPAPPDFTGSAFIRQILVSFGNGADFSTFDAALYHRASSAALQWLRDIGPLLWRKGKAYPSTPRELDRMFANGEVDFSMSYSPAFASVRIEKGEFAPGTRTFVFDTGTLANYSYLAIPFNAGNTRGATLAINYLMSWDAVLGLSRTLKTPFPLDRSRLTVTEKARANELPRGPATLSENELKQHAIPEPDIEYLVRLERDWRAQVLPA